MHRYFYSNTIPDFLKASTEEIFGLLTLRSGFADEVTQKNAWLEQITILKKILEEYNGTIFFEYSIPRIGGRVDIILIIKNVIFLLEFKVGEKKFISSSLDQVWDYALDLKNFHETSHDPLIAPILIATGAEFVIPVITKTPHNDNLLFPIKSNIESLNEIIHNVIQLAKGDDIDATTWSMGRYSPTPTIIEAALALFNQHSVADISRSDASAINLTRTSNAISEIVNRSKQNSEKAICFVTGVPGAGKTLVGLDIATKHMDKEGKSTSVYLSGNGPLVAILREALTRDKVKRERNKGSKVKKGEVFGEVKLVIQNVHNFRDDCLKDTNPPIDHVAVFDEAQRAWNLQQTIDFMSRKRGMKSFAHSEPEFLISCLDRHNDYAVIVCLVGGGQEINTGEAGIGEWLDSVERSFPHWKVYLSSQLTDSEYAAANHINILKQKISVEYNNDLHLSVSMRSYRAENVSSLVKSILDMKLEDAKDHYQQLKDRYPIVITRDFSKAKRWLRVKARGTERYGLIVSSKASRLKPYGIDVKTPMNPVNWFLEGKEDIRSSYFLEDVATEFHVQGLELDWCCVAWDADFRYSPEGWRCYELLLRSEKPAKWNNVVKEYRRQYLKNAYRVLLTRARQGMIIVVPSGDNEDNTRKPEFYDASFDYLRSIGFESI